MANKKKVREGTGTAGVSGHFGGGNKHDPYASGRTKKDTPWYMKSMKEVENDVKTSLVESKKRAIKEAAATKKSSTRVSLSDSSGKRTRKHIDEFKGVDNTYKESTPLPEAKGKGFCFKCMSKKDECECKDKGAKKESKEPTFRQLIEAEGGLGSLLFGAEGKEKAKTLPKSEKPLEQGDLAQDQDFRPKVEKEEKMGAK
jgi:hypothetical protein